MAKKYKTKWETTPVGTALFAYIDEADDYEGSRKYKIKLVLPEDDPFVKELEEHVDAVFDERRGEIDSPGKGRKKAKVAEASYPFIEEFDQDDDEPTGNVIISFSANEQFKNNKDGGKMKDIILKIYDENGDLLDREDHPKIRNGQKVKVIFTKYDFAMAATCKVGTSLRLQGLYLQEGGGSKGRGESDAGGRAGGLGMFINHASNCQSFLGTSGDVVEDARMAIKLHELTSDLKDEYKDLMGLKGNEIGFMVGNVVLKACQACQTFDEVEAYAHEYLAGYYDVLRNYISKGVDVDQTLEDIGYYDEPGDASQAEKKAPVDDDEEIPF